MGVTGVGSSNPSAYALNGGAGAEGGGAAQGGGYAIDIPAPGSKLNFNGSGGGGGGGSPGGLDLQA